MSNKDRSDPQAAVRRLPPAASLVRALGGRFSAELGIRVASGKSSELFKWLLAATLFGARISEKLAKRTYREFEKERLLTPRAILRRGWDGLVEVLDRGGYTRYDFKTATKLLDLSNALMNSCSGDLGKLHESALDSGDLARKIKSLAKGIGDVTANIFLRELREIWPKAQPPLSAPAMAAAKDLGLLPDRIDDQGAMERLKRVWSDEANRIEDFPDFEAALVRHGLAMRRRRDGRRPAETPAPVSL